MDWSRARFDATFLVDTSSDDAQKDWRDDQLGSKGFIVRRLDGRGMRDEISMITHFAAAFQWPRFAWYNGQLWYEELLNPESFANSAGVIISIANPSTILSSEPQAKGSLKWFVAVMSECQNSWGRHDPNSNFEALREPAIPFHVLLETSELDPFLVRDSWVESGANLQDL